MRRRLAGLLGVLSTLLHVPAATAAPPRVEYRNDRLTLHAEDAPLQAVLDELRRQSGAEVRGEAPPRASVTIDLAAVPLREALERLLGDRSFTLTYGDDGQLKAIELKGGPQAVPSARPEAPAPARMTRKEMWDGVAAAFNGDPRVTLPPRLAAVAGQEEVGLVALLGAASRVEDRRVRGQAWRTGLRTVEEDQGIRNALISAVGNMDDAELAAFARALAAQTPDPPEDLAKLVARECRVPELRARARAVLRQLRRESRTAQR